MVVLRWQQAEGRRHAVRQIGVAGGPTVDESFEALCGEIVTPRRKDFPSLGGHWFDPTCPGCDSVWRSANVTSTGVVVEVFNV